MRIGAGRRVGLKNSRDCDDRILERRNGDNRAAGAARTYRFLLQIIQQKPAKLGQCAHWMTSHGTGESGARALLQTESPRSPSCESMLIWGRSAAFHKGT